MIHLTDLQHLKNKKPFSCLTAYDAGFARLISDQGVHLILIGDSLGMVVQGRDSTIAVTLKDMVYHTQCVQRGNRNSFLMADMPFAQHSDIQSAVRAATALMRAGAHAIKIEGGAWLQETIVAMRRCGIPVCVHLGLCPQSMHLYGGFKKQGGDEKSKKSIIAEAKIVAEAGADLLLLESVPAELTAELCQAVTVPIIGIGAGQADAQVLVLPDLLGITPNPPSFVMRFKNENSGISERIQIYHQAVIDGAFPSPLPDPIKF